MLSKVSNQTHYTRKVKSLLDRIFGRSPVKDSLLDRAVKYYQEYSSVNAELSRLENSPDLQKNLKVFKQQLKSERTSRHTQLLEICLEIIHLTEAESFNECNRKSAQLLGTIALLSPTEGVKVAPQNEINKPLYKAVICLRLLDQLCMSNTIVDSHISPYFKDISPAQYSEFATIAPEAYSRFIQQVKVPLVMAAILQDIGDFHPDGQLIITGESGVLDPYRVLTVAERKPLLKINYRETVNYFVDGLGLREYVGNCKEDRDQFNKNEQAKLMFIKRLLKTSLTPNTSTGNLLKVPQLYVSIILSTKKNYNYKLLPKVFQSLNQNATKGGCSQEVVDALYKVTGIFPQGFGITYIPIDKRGKQQDIYEYAIVNQLYPEDPLEPSCRLATRQLTFINHGQNSIIKSSQNLYFIETAKKLAYISRERLNQILELLASNYKARQQLDLLPRCWHADVFFSVKNNQKLWDKSVKVLK
jgi:hypothetical protein